MPSKRNRQGKEFTYLHLFAHVQRSEEYTAMAIVKEHMAKDDNTFDAAYQAVSGYLRRKLEGEKRGNPVYYQGGKILGLIAEQEGPMPSKKRLSVSLW